MTFPGQRVHRLLNQDEKDRNARFERCWIPEVLIANLAPPDASNWLSQSQTFVSITSPNPNDFVDWTQPISLQWHHELLSREVHSNLYQSRVLPCESDSSKDC